MRLPGRVRPVLYWAAAAVVLAGCRPASADDLIRFWAFGREGEVVAELVRDFERQHPGIRVQVQQIPWTAAHEKLITSHMGGSSPDIAQLGNTWIPEFVTLGALDSLDGRQRGSSAVLVDRYFPGIWATNIIDRTLYGIPWYVDTRVMFYRKDLLRAAGYDSVPGTWSGWLDAMRAMKRGGPADHYPLVLPLNEWTPPVILGLQAGSALIDENGFGTFAAPPFRRAFDFFLTLFRERLAPPVNNTEIANLYQEFSRGRIAMYLTGPWNLGEFRRRLPAEQQGDWGTAPLPGPDGPGVSLAGGSSLVVFKHSTNKDAAWRLIEFLSAPAQQVKFYHLTGDLPARTDAWEDSTLATDREAAAFRIQLGRVVATPMVPEWEQVATQVMDHAETAVRGGKTAEEALRRLDLDVNRILERRRYLLARRATPAPAARAP